MQNLSLKTSTLLELFKTCSKELDQQPIKIYNAATREEEDKYFDGENLLQTLDRVQQELTGIHVVVSRLASYQSDTLTVKDFTIGQIFYHDGEKFKTTDIGSRTVSAIWIAPEVDEHASIYQGPPYQVGETTFDERKMAEITLSWEN